MVDQVPEEHKHSGESWAAEQDELIRSVACVVEGPVEDEIIDALLKLRDDLQDGATWGRLRK